VIIEGKGNSGKSALLRIYRRINHQNSFYLTVSSQQHNQWSQKINKTLHHHGLNLLGSRINYKETVIMVEDVHMVQETSLEQIHRMLAYKKWQKENQEYTLKNVKFVITGQQIP
jgi:ABC-type transport system involved in cytochrome c biogenesis ATPase subunit